MKDPRVEEPVVIESLSDIEQDDELHDHEPASMREDPKLLTDSIIGMQS